jgi:hypothetical protein
MMSSMVSRPPAADSARALKHFESLLEFETDCWMKASAWFPIDF